MVPDSKPSLQVDDPRARPIFSQSISNMSQVLFFFPCVAHRSCSLRCLTCKLVLIQHRTHALLLFSDPVSVKICFLPFLTSPIHIPVLLKVFIQNHLQAFSLPLSSPVSVPAVDPTVATGSKLP